MNEQNLNINELRRKADGILNVVNNVRETYDIVGSSQHISELHKLDSCAKLNNILNMLDDELTDINMQLLNLEK